MRVFSFFVVLISLLLSAGNSTYANKATPSSTPAFVAHFDVDCPSLYTGSNAGITVIEDLDDIHPEEDLHGENDKNTLSKPTFPNGVLNTLATLANNANCRVWSASSKKHTKNAVRIWGNSCPIYLANGVLRI